MSIIVGGGVSGLVTAYWLTKAGNNVTLFEPGAVGGVIQSSSVEGFTLEQGPNVLVEKPALMAVIDELGLRSKVVYPQVKSYRQFVWRAGEACEVKRSPALLWSGFFDAWSALCFVPRVFFKGTLAATGDDLTIAEFLKPLIGARAVTELFDPVMKGIYGGSVESLSARSVFPSLWQAARDGKSIREYVSGRPKRGRIFVLEGGLQTLTDALARACGDRLSVEKEVVCGLVKQDDGYSVALESGSTRGAKNVYFATSGPATAHALGSFAIDLSEKLEKVNYAALSIVHCRVDKPNSLPANAFGTLFPEGQKSKLLGIMYNTKLFPHLAPAGKDLLTLMFGGVGQDDIIEASDNDLKHRALEELSERCGINEATPLAVTRWGRAIPQYELGHHQLVEEMASLEGEHPGLFFVGADRGGVSVPDRFEYLREVIRAKGSRCFGCKRTPDKVGILIAQLGTPDAPTEGALRPYLRQFLSDRRVIEKNRLLWWLILNGIILRVRPKRSAALYERVWKEDGSPLLSITRQQSQGLREILESASPNVEVDFGMRYGKPSLEDGIDRLLERGCRRFVVFPMYPQYSAATTGSALDAVYPRLLKERWVPSVHVVQPYYVHKRYLEALAKSVQQYYETVGERPERLLISYHGIPQEYARKGDPYCCMCRETTAALLPLLPVGQEETIHCYQSQFGRDPWLQPYTEDVVEQLAKEGVKRIAVICPGFPTDCLETIDEIGHEAAELFRKHGGEELTLIPGLNARPEWFVAMADIISEEAHSWLTDKSMPPGACLPCTWRK